MCRKKTVSERGKRYQIREGEDKREKLMRTSKMFFSAADVM